MNDSTTRAAATLGRPSNAPPLYSQDGKGYEATVFEHYFIGGCDWLVTEYDPEEDRAFGWACLNGDTQNAELGYTSLAELAEVSVPLAVQVESNGMAEPIVIGYTGVERDAGWPPGLTLREAIALVDERHGR